MGQAFLDALKAGGHVYGRGAYFSEFAIYPHWWRKLLDIDDKDTEKYTVILAQVFTGCSKDYGAAWAPDLLVEPTGYHSVCGTESDQKLLFVVKNTTLARIQSVATLVSWF